MALKKEILFPFSALLDLWQQSALMPRAGLGSGRKGKVDRRLKWARSQQRAAALIHYPASFSHTAIFRYWALSAKKINGGWGGPGDKEGRTRGRQFLSPHLRREAPSGFLLQRQGIRWDPSGSNSICSSRKSSFRQRAQDPSAAELNTGALSMFLSLTLQRRREGCDCIPGKDYYSRRATRQ